MPTSPSSARERDERGRRLVVRNGSHQPREVLTSAGAVEVVAPRVNDRRIDPDTGERAVLLGDPAALVPQDPEDQRGVAAAVPARPVHQRLRSRAGPVPRQLGGPVQPVITRLTETWQAEQRAFADRDLSEVDYVYLWADGIHVNIRLEEHKLCLLVMIGVRADGRKELVALTDGYRESTESWADLLRDCPRRGMRAPVLAVGDGALGFWGALREVFPQTREQRCWFHKIANVLGALPEVAHPGAKKALAEIWNAEDKRHALAAATGLRGRLRGEVPQGRREDHRRPRGAARVLRLPRRALGPPAHHEPHRVDLRDRPAPDEDHPRAGLKAAGLAMAYKLIEAAQARWRAVNAPHLVALVRAGARSRPASSSNDPTRSPPRPKEAA